MPSRAIADTVAEFEAPFANLVKTQLDAQPAVKEETRTFPNGGSQPTGRKKFF